MANIKKPSDTAARKPGRPPKFVEAKPFDARSDRAAPVAVTKPATKPFVAPKPAAQPAPIVPPVVVKAPEPVKMPEPVVARTPEPIEAPEPAVAKAPEPVVAKAPAPAAVAAPTAPADPAPVADAPRATESAATYARTPASTKGFPMATTFAPSTAAVSPEGIQAMFSDLQTRTKASVEKSARLAEEMGEFAKGNVEAVMTSGRIAAKGAETLGQEAVEYGKKSFEGAAAAFKTMIAAKSPTELFKLQSDYARSSFDAAVTEGSKLSEAWLKLFGEIAQPLSSRVALAAEKIKAPVA